MFNKVRNRLRFLIIGIGSAILVVSFLIVYLVMRINLDNESKSRLERAIELTINNPAPDRYKQTEVMIFKIDGNKVTQYNDNYIRYDNSLLVELYEQCSSKKNSPTKVSKNYFYYEIISLKGELVYFVYDATLPMQNLNVLLITLAAFFIAFVIIIAAVAISVSNRVVNPLEVTYVKQKEFMENASHELKTPLAIISANLDALNGIDKENKKWINNIKNQISRMNKLVIEILELFRIESRNETIEEEINLSKYLEKTILSFEVLTYEKNIRLEKEIDEDVTINAKESDVDKMINILLDNALKYVSKDGYIDIKLKKDKRRISLIVENSGGNLDKDDLGNIFERFYKKNDEDKKSFGLGLAILKAIVNKLNGRVSVEWQKEVYTRFIVEL